MSEGDQRVRRIAIVGKSQQLWPVATLLANSLPEGMRLVLVEDVESVPPAAVTVRLDDPFLLRLGIGAKDFSTTDSAVFALGVTLLDWQGEGSRLHLTGSGSLPAIDDIAIHQILLRAALSYDQAQKLAYLYQPFRFPARAVEAGKFAFQSTDLRSPMSMLRPTVQIDQADFAALLKDRFPTDRAEIVKGKPSAGLAHKGSEFIEQIDLDNGHGIKADFFVDVSGGLDDLADKRRQMDWHPLFEGLPFDRLASARNAEVLPPSEKQEAAQAIDGGLLVQTPLRETSIAQLVYASRELTDDAARSLLGDGAQSTMFKPGYVNAPWHGNVARLGTASVKFGPYLSADITMLLRQTMVLAAHMPTRLDMTVEARDYNRRHLIAVEQVRDFVLLPFALNRREDAIWSEMRDSKLSENLAIKIEQFRSRGRLASFEGEIFDEQSWIDLMIGCGIVPGRYDPMAASLDMTHMARRLKNLSVAFDQALVRTPEYEDGVRDFGSNETR
ncbi:MAG: tryptophan 7-halogenase [Parasphingorhabdus sp.]|uniref:tryptophan 7-halogenase n=3 Tax=Parasphingorhabdus sp. TaxID=2709688 RepID=UPI00326336D0